MADYGIDPFGKLMQAEQMIAQDRFQRQKYDDLMQRQMQADTLAATDRQQRIDAASFIPNELQAQYDVQAEAPGVALPIDPQRAMLDAYRGSGGNPYALGEISKYSKMLESNKPATAKTPAYSATGDYVATVKEAYRNANEGREIPAKELAEKMVGFKRPSPYVQGQAQREKELSKVGVAANKGIYEGAVNAKKSIIKIDKLINELNTSDALTGMGADIAKQFARIGAEIGIERAKGTVIDTEYLNALMGSEVFPLIKQLGIGARGMDTPAERQFLREVMTGQIPMNKGTLLKMAQDRRQAAQMDVVRYQERDSVGAMDGLYGQGFTKLTFDGDSAGSGGMDQSRPVTKGGVTGYRQPNGDVLGANGEKLN